MLRKSVFLARHLPDVEHALRPSVEPPLRVFDVRQMTGEEYALPEHVDLLAMSRGECR